MSDSLPPSGHVVDLSVKFTSDAPVATELRHLSQVHVPTHRKPKKPKRTVPPDADSDSASVSETSPKAVPEREPEPVVFEDAFFVPVVGDDTVGNPHPDDYRYLRQTIRNIDVECVDENRTLHITSLPEGFYESSLFYYFRQFGDIVRLIVPRNRANGEVETNEAYIEFGRGDVAEIVFEEFRDRPFLYDGESIGVKLIPNDDNLYLPFREARRRLLLPKTIAKHRENRIRRTIQESHLIHDHMLWTVDDVQRYRDRQEEKMERNRKKLCEAGLSGYSRLPFKRKATSEPAECPSPKRRKLNS